MCEFSRRPRVLLMAYACDPERGGECAIGWNRARQSADFCDTWVLCAKEANQAAIERYLEKHGPVPGLTFEFVPEPWWERWRQLIPIPVLFYLTYNLWHRRAYRVARRLHRRVQFDLAHQVNYVGYREPGYLWKLNVPFVWGPIGGTQNYPWRFWLEAGVWQGTTELLRNILNWAQLRFSRRVRGAAQKAAVVLAANSTNQRDVFYATGVWPTVQIDTGIASVTPSPSKQFAGSTHLRILWSGIFDSRKALSLLIKALAELPADVSYEVRVLGGGRLQKQWRRLAQRLNVDHRITWLGHLPFHAAVQQNDWADVFVFTSLRDTTGTVVLEAMGAGLPIVCLDHQGVQDVVTNECGMKIALTTPRQVVRELAESLTLLARDASLRARLSRGAAERAQMYQWNYQGRQIAAVYHQVLDGRL